MPAQSPTLSPTLSAITAGLRGIVLGDAGLDLAHDVGAHVGALGEDAAAEAGEDGDQGAAEAEADQRVHRLLRLHVEPRGEDAVVARHAQQGEAGDEHPGDGAAAEGDVERRAEPAARRLGHAGVGADGDVHADEAGRRRSEAADEEADRHLDVLQRDERDEEDDADDGDGPVLAAQVRRGSLLDRRRQATHDLVAGGQREEGATRDQAVHDGGRRADQRDEHTAVG